MKKYKDTLYKIETPSIYFHTIVLDKGSRFILTLADYAHAT